jgi:hypothetical protein
LGGLAFRCVILKRYDTRDARRLRGGERDRLQHAAPALGRIDEPFHFGYVQELANGRWFPDPRTTFLSKEVGSSLSAAPGSSVVQQNLPGIITFREFFDRKDSREPVRNWRGRPESSLQSSQILNYEALQAPLAYVILAVPERVFAFVPLPRRVLILRLIAGIGGALLLYFASERLFSHLGIGDAYKNIALFCVFSSQMTWATLAHVGNDWLAVPLAVWLLASVICYDKNPGGGRHRLQQFWRSGY